MSVKGFLKKLFDGNMEDQRAGFSTLENFHGPAQRPADIDTGTLVFVCHKEAHGEGG